MTLTQEQKNARNKDNGQFGSIQRLENPDVTLGAPPEAARVYETFTALLTDQIGDTEVVAAHPETKSEARRKLVNLRGEPGGAVRQVFLHSRNSPDSGLGETVSVAGPKDGRPIIVNVRSGLPRLKVTSGKAIIFADSVWGNSIDVADGAEAVVFGNSDAKITSRVEEGGSYTAVSPSLKNRFWVAGPGEITREFGAAVTCDECDEPIEDGDAFCMDCKCSCGNTLNDGEGYDGKCGTCADAAEDDEDEDDYDEEDGEDGGENLFVMSLEDASGEAEEYCVNKCGDGHYEVTSSLDDPLAEFYLNCDEEDHSELQSAAIKALKEAGVFVIDPEDELVVSTPQPVVPELVADPDLQMAW